MHRPVRSSCSVAVGVLVFAGCAICQNADSPDAHECSSAAQRLHADSLPEKAWGAHLAAACGISGLAAEIGTELDRLHPESLAKSSWDSEPFWVGRSMLDALIQLRQPLEASVLASIARGFPTEATILMLRDAAANRALLTAVRAHPGSGEWVAASNALARLRAPGFAATILAEIPLTHSFWVSATGKAPREGTGSSTGSGGSTGRVPPGFPPIGIYTLTAQHAPDAELVSDGGTPIYSLRKIFEPGIESTIWSPERYCFRCLEIGYLAELAQLSRMEVERAVEPETDVKWTDWLHLHAEISPGLANQQSTLKQLAKALASAGALQPSEFGTTLHIEVRIEDRRDNRNEPLPKYPSFEFQLR